MNDLSGMTDGVCYQTLIEQQPTAIPAIRNLLANGQSPAQIFTRVKNGQPNREFVALLFAGAACHIQEVEHESVG